MSEKHIPHSLRGIERRLFVLAGAAILLLTCIWQDGWLWLASTVFAAPVFPPGMEQDIANIVGYAILALNIGTWVLFTFLNFLLDPLFVFGFGTTLMGILNQIWQLARDLMNIIFAVALIAAAIYTIVTAKKEFLSQHAPKFIVAVILVNFSWFLPRVVIDIAHVGAAAVYGIPSLLTSGAQCMVTYAANDPVPPAAAPFCRFPPGQNTAICPCTGVTDVQFFLSDADAKNLQQNQQYFCPLGPAFCYKEEVLNFATIAPHSGVINGLVVNHARLGSLASVPAPPPAGPGSDVSRMISFLLREAIVLAIHIALFFPLLAMVIAFFIRIPVLWITIAFMPFYFLDLLLGGAGEEFTQGYPKKILKTFLKAAFLPMLVAVPLTVGFILLNAASQIPTNEIAVIPIRLFDGLNNLWQLLWLCMALGVMWVGVFAVLKGDDILSTGAQSIKGYGQTLGKIALKSPLAIPSMPGTSGNVSLLGGLQMPRAFESALSGGMPLKKAWGQMLRSDRPPETVRKAAVALNEAGSKAEKEALAKAALALANAADGKTWTAEFENVRKALATRGITAAPTDVHIVIDQLQREGLNLNLTAAQIKQIQEKQQKIGGATP